MTLNIGSGWKPVWSCYLLLAAFIVAYDATAVNFTVSQDFCTNITCPVDSCSLPFGTHPKHPCCSRDLCHCFVNTTRTFHSVGSTWVTEGCRKCRCNTHLKTPEFRHVYTIDCSSLYCPSQPSKCSPMLERCCPSCRTASVKQCIDVSTGNVKNDGDRWIQKSSHTCEKCTCESGEVACTLIDCKPLTCPSGQVPKSLPDQCCSTYCRNGTISPHQPCQYKNRTYRTSIERYELLDFPCNERSCYCRHGDWECLNDTCPTDCFKNNTILFGAPGQCCRICAGTLSCIDDNGRVREAGELWTDESAGKQCGCVDSQIKCMLLTSRTSERRGSLPPERNLKYTHIVIISLVSALVLIISCLVLWAVLRKYHRRRFTSDGPSKNPEASNNIDKTTLVTMQYSKINEDEHIDENSNQCAVALIT